MGNLFFENSLVSTNHNIFLSQTSRIKFVVDLSQVSEENPGDTGRMYSLGEVNFIQGMHDFGNCKNSVGLKAALALVWSF
jgi:hypothetical protein